MNISNINELEAVMESHGINSQLFGVGEAKTLENLWKELQDGETFLEIRNKTLIRKIRVVSIRVHYKTEEGQRYVIREDRQEFNDGRVRVRSFLEASVSEKLLLQETPEMGAKRALQEELQLDVIGEIQRGTSRIEEKYSQSYPGLKTIYETHLFRYDLHHDEFRKDGYEERQENKTTYFGVYRQKDLEIALSAVQTASQLLQKMQKTLNSTNIQTKQDESPVTAADLCGQVIIRKSLKKEFPEDRVFAEEDSSLLRENLKLRKVVLTSLQTVMEISEEEMMTLLEDKGNPQALRQWYLDPIDGTKGFISGEQYAIALALVKKGEVQMSVLGCPNFNQLSPLSAEIFYAIKNFGAYRIETNAKETLLSVNRTGSLNQLMSCESKNHSKNSVLPQLLKRLGIEIPPLKLDSQVKYACLASGIASLYLRIQPGWVENAWDHAAGLLLVTEAGGLVTDTRGQPLVFNGQTLEGIKGIIVSDGRYHQQILEILQQLM
ncbi:inositol monophosphatase family protein [Deltaproteobacteria bacterium TL4]